jgi:outer membrane protein TolC
MSFPRVPLALCVLLGAVSARAQDVFPLAEDPGLVALVAEALERSPVVRRARFESEAARERVAQAEAFPDPTLTLGYEYGGRGLAPGADDDTGPRVAVSQPLPGSGKRRLAALVAEKDAARVGHGVERARLTLVYGLRRGYAQLLLARENLALLDEQERQVRDLEALTRSRYAVGLAEQADVLRAQAELARLAQMRAHEDALRVSAEAELNRIAARPSGLAVEPTLRLRDFDPRRVPVPSVDEVVRLSNGLSPDVAAGLAQVERAEATLAAARRDAKPDFVASASYLNRGSIPGRFSLDLGILLPLHKSKRQERRVAESAAALRAAQADCEAMMLEVRAVAERSRADLDAAVREAAAYSGGVLTADALASESALAGFRAGRLPFVAVLDAQRAWNQDRGKHAELLYHVLWHSARLEAWMAEE